MIRIVTLAAVAALAAQSASAEESIHISTAGKSAEQVHTEVVKAARRLCARALTSSPFAVSEMAPCVADTVKDAMSQMEDPALRVANR